MRLNNEQLLDKVKQNIVICQWRADQMIDLRETDISRYFVITDSIIVLSLDHKVYF